MSTKAGSFWSRPSSSFRAESAPPTGTQGQETPVSLWRSPLGLALASALALVGFIRGAHAIGDNSMFTHLRTGMDMARTGAIPRTDPYSFTAHGHPWVVQSWFPEWTYGWLHRIGGFKMVVLEQALLMAGIAVLFYALARANTPLRTFAAAGLAIGFAVPWWSQRPLLFGLIAFGLTILVVERRWNPWWLVPIVWLWVNSHGSFPLGALWLVARGAGEAIERRGWPVETLRYGGFFAIGLVASILNPLGYKLLAFPFTTIEKRTVFKHIVEWFSPNFQDKLPGITLAFLFAGLLLVFRRGVRWSDVVPAAVFIAIGLIAQRNLGPAAVVLAPVFGHAMTARPGERWGPREGIRAVAVAVGVVIALQFLFWGVRIYRKGSLDLKHYPVAAVGFLQTSGLRGPSHRLVTVDRVGNYLEAKFGASARVFIDDRYDMFPTSVSDDSFALLRGEPDYQTTLDKYHVDVVLLDDRMSIAVNLSGSDQWKQVYDDPDHWVVFQRK